MSILGSFFSVRCNHLDPLASNRSSIESFHQSSHCHKLRHQLAILEYRQKGFHRKLPRQKRDFLLWSAPTWMAIRMAWVLSPYHTWFSRIRDPLFCSWKGAIYKEFLQGNRVSLLNLSCKHLKNLTQGPIYYPLLWNLWWYVRYNKNYFGRPFHRVQLHRIQLTLFKTFPLFFHRCPRTSHLNFLLEKN